MGIVAAVVAFLVVGIAYDQLIEHGGTSFFAGLVGAFFAWQYCQKKENEELQKILNPAPEVWPVSLPIAWGSIRDVLDSAMVVTGSGGSSRWRLQKEDDSRGLISAQLSFNQMLGSATSPQMVPRTVVCNVTLTPQGSSTKVDVTYQAISPMGAGVVKRIIDDTQKAFTASMNANREIKPEV